MKKVKDVIWFPKPMKKIPEPGSLYERKKQQLPKSKKGKVAFMGLV